MLTILFGNGIGTIFINIFPESTLKPTNLWMPESITFLSLNQTPLFVLALILILLVFISFIESVKSKKNYEWTGKNSSKEIRYRI